MAMARKRRYLVLSGLADAGFEEFAEQQRQALAACPEAAAISDDEAEEFLVAAAGFDWLEVSDLGAYIRRLGLSHPPELLYDPYRLSRYFFRRWGDPAVREKIKTPKIGLHPDWVARVRQRGNVAELRRAVLNMAIGPGIAAMRRSGLEDFIPKVIEALQPFERAKFDAQILYAKVRMHQLMHEPEPAWMPTQWEQARVRRRIRLHDVQIGSLGRSQRALRGERKALVNRIRAAGRQDQPELGRLAGQLEAVQAERQAAEERHATALTEQSQQFEAALAELKRQAEAMRRSYAAALDLRDRLVARPGGAGNG
jgi:hypothetical protein